MKKVLCEILMVLTVFFHLSSAVVLAQTVRADYPNEALAVRIDRISKSFNGAIGFDARMVRNINVKELKAEGDLENLLSQSLNETGFTFQKVSGKSYVIVKRDLQPQKLKWVQVTGTVIDKSDNSTLVGVNIVIKGTGNGVVTDLDGNFSIKVPLGYTLMFSYIGFNKKEILIDKAYAKLVVKLDNSSEAIGEVTVRARQRRHNEISVLKERQNSAIVQNAISADLIEKTASMTTTEALQKVSGVTVTDGKYVAVRGLGGRSVIGQLNGVRLASSDPDRSSIPLDLVPASLLDNVTVYKTVTPDKPADAASGIVELKTKSVPDSLTFSVAVQTGLNTNIGIWGQYNSFWNSDMGFLGTKINDKKLSRDFLNLSNKYPGGIPGIQRMIANSGYTNDTKEEIDQINGLMRAFDPVATTSYQRAPLNQHYSISFGNTFDIFQGHALGVIISADYFKRIKDIYHGNVAQYSIYQGVVSGNDNIYSPRHIPNYITPNSLFMGKYQTYQQNKGLETLNYGVLGGLTYQFSKNHEVSFQYMGSWGGENEALNMNGAYEYTGLSGDVTSIVYSLKQTFRNLQTYNLQGEHQLFNGQCAPHLSYNLSVSKSEQNQPDFRYANLIDYTPEGGVWVSRPSIGGVAGGIDYSWTEHLYALASGYVNNFSSYGTLQAEPNGRRWRNLDETDYNHKLDLEVPFPLLGQKQSFKGGMSYLSRERQFKENVLYLPGSNFDHSVGAGALTLIDVEGDLNRLVSPEVIGVKMPDGSTEEGEIPIGGFLYNIKKSPNNYNGFYETYAFYGMLDLAFGDLRMTGGVRFEKSDIESSVDTKDVYLDPSLTRTDSEGNTSSSVYREPNSVYKTDYKPYYSLNTTYRYKKDMNFRLAYNTTLARPELREITNIFEFDPYQMGLVVGNPDLKNQKTYNLDFRWEWFPNSGEVVAVSAFGKKIENQLVKVFSLATAGLAATYPEFPIIRFENDAHSGKIWGLEFEITKDVSRFWGARGNLFLGANLMLAQSEIKKSDKRLAANRFIDRHAPENSPLFEQAPYSVNAWLNYVNKRWGTNINASFSMVGERLVQINLTGEPDLYTRPAPVLDLILSQKLSHRIEMKGYAKNILNPVMKTVYANPDTGGKWYGHEYLNQSYKEGCEIMLGITYNLY